MKAAAQKVSAVDEQETARQKASTPAEQEAAARKASTANELETARRQEQQAALRAELTWQRETPLNFENVSRLYPDMRDLVLGNRIFRLIELTDAVHIPVATPVGKVTGMILEGCSTRELYDMLHTEDESVVAVSVLELVAEADEVLASEAAQEQTDETSSSATPSELGPLEEEERAEADEWKVVKRPSKQKRR